MHKPRKWSSKMVRRADETRAILAERFPLAFAGKGQPKRPLKIRIFQDIVAAAPDLVRSNVRLALADYTSGPTYLNAMRDGAVRIDLNGEPAGTVTAEHQEYARRRVKRQRRRAKAAAEARIEREAA